MLRLRALLRFLPLAVVAALLLAPAVLAQLPANPLNDLFSLGEGSGQRPAEVEVRQPAAPPVTAAPRARCGPGARPEPDIQGRVPAGSATDGLWCNVSLLAHRGSSGGLKVLRHVDRAGRECAYYDTALVFPLNAVNLRTDGLGVVVLDMSDPANPRQTDLLTDPPMLSPHESLSLNAERGLLAAVNGNPATSPGTVSLFDVDTDCRKPVRRFTLPLARFGHESGFSRDGRTFYATGTATDSVTAIDVTETTRPRVLWQGRLRAHGMTLSEDGNRAYVADASGQNMLILDTSEIQARKPEPRVREVSRVTWSPVSIPQNAIPFTRGGHPYVLEFDEYDAATLVAGPEDEVGAARIIDIADERHPRVVANLRLEVNQPAGHRAAARDPGAASPVQGYAAHYCAVATRVDPTVVACSFIASGLRVFDISELTAPKEIAYFVAPTRARADNGAQASNFAMSQPVIVPERREVWYTDGTSGFYALRVAPEAWPAAAAAGAPAPPAAPARACRSRRRFAAHVWLPRRDRVRSVLATLGGRRVRAVRRIGGRVRVTVDLRRFGRRVVRLRVRVRMGSGRAIRTLRVYHPCATRVPRPSRSRF